jgi:tetratricopeptide (TPR) repeat protein
MMLRLIPLLIAIVLAIPPVASRAANAISDDDVSMRLAQLDSALVHRQYYIKKRQHSIDSLRLCLQSKPNDMELLDKIVTAYTAFNNDSTLYYIDLAMCTATSDDLLKFKLKRATLLPLAGFFETAIDEYSAINPDSVPGYLKAGYYDSGRQMHSYIASFYMAYPDVYADNTRKCIALQKQLIDALPRNSVQYKFNLGEYYFLTGETSKAEALLTELIEHNHPDRKLAARAMHHLSSIAKARGDENGHIYYLAGSAIEDIMEATREVVSLQDLGTTLYEHGDAERAYNYISAALANAVECGAAVRMVESSRGLPIIQQTHFDHVRQWRHTMYIVVVVMALLMIGLVALLILIRREIRQMATLQQSLKKANHTKEIYISQFLSLCSIYMDKLNQFCKIANRKISTGKVDDLYKLTKSGKFVEEQSREFYEVFDDAFLHIYPTFVADVNCLLRDDAQIELKEGERLNTDLRILAFIRLGIEESARIAQVLNYSLNTIYSYRNRMKSRAINRDTFEADILRIGSVD